MFDVYYTSGALNPENCLDSQSSLITDKISRYSFHFLLNLILWISKMPQSYYKRHLCAGLYHATIQLYLIYLIINKTLFRRGHSITERRRRRGRSEVMLLGVSLFSFSSITEES